MSIALQIVILLKKYLLLFGAVLAKRHYVHYIAMTSTEKVNSLMISHLIKIDNLNNQ